MPGRKSGVPRTTPLLCVPHDGGWLIAGSYFGSPKVPLWVGNLRATEQAQIRVKGDDIDATWREIEGEERATMWKVMLRTWPNFAKYEERTSRVIRCSSWSARERNRRCPVRSVPAPTHVVAHLSNSYTCWPTACASTASSTRGRTDPRARAAAARPSSPSTCWCSPAT